MSPRALIANGARRSLVRAALVRGVLVLGALVLAACGGSGDGGASGVGDPASNPTVAATAGSVAPASVAAPELLQFRAPLVGGGTFDASTLAGTPTVFWFWAPN